MKNASVQPGGYPGVVPPPPDVAADVNFTESRWNEITQMSCIVATTLFVFLRCFTKYVIAGDFLLDDWMSVAAWAFSIVYFALGLACAPLGLGIHMWNITPDTFLKLFRIGYVLEILYGPTILLTKLAILLLLLRVFRVDKRFVVSVNIIIGFNILYYITMVIVKVFMCRPIRKFWDHAQPGTCLNINVLFISNCIVAIITDCAILVAPMPIIWNLQMGTRKKLGCSFALAIGSIACVISVLRLKHSIETKDSPDKSYTSEAVLLYSSGEIAIGIVCGCIPVIPSLYRHYHKKLASAISLSQSSRGLSTKNYNGIMPLQEYSSREYINHAEQDT